MAAWTRIIFSCALCLTASVGLTPIPLVWACNQLRDDSSGTELVCRMNNDMHYAEFTLCGPRGPKVDWSMLTIKDWRQDYKLINNCTHQFEINLYPRSAVNCGSVPSNVQSCQITDGTSTTTKETTTDTKKNTITTTITDVSPIIGTITTTTQSTLTPPPNTSTPTITARIATIQWIVLVIGTYGTPVIVILLCIGYVFSQKCRGDCSCRCSGTCCYCRSSGSCCYQKEPVKKNISMDMNSKSRYSV